jgi:tetratricopeptide (TPR) repeat protein
LCGTPLKTAGAKGEPVSPGAATVPLSDEGRTTDGLFKEDGNSTAAETSRVGRLEMDSLLRRPAPSKSSQQEESNAQTPTEGEAPVTTALSSIGNDNERPSEESSSNTVQPEATLRAKQEAATVVVAATNEKRVAEPSAKKKKTEQSARRMWQVAAFVLLVVAVGATALAFYYSRRAGARDAQGNAPISISDQQRLVEEKLAEAETLLAAGNVTDAIARLRYAIRLDPSNAKAHRLLAEALERTGAVNEAIDEYRAATQHDPNNEETWLRYADALRRVGRTDEAREIYQKLSSSSSEEVARVAKEQLAALPPATVSNVNGSRDERTQNLREENGANNNNTTASSSPASTQGGAPTASANNSGAGKSGNDPVASYNTAMKIIEGKDIRKMNRAELIRAYELFQYAQQGPHAGDATRHLRDLDKELFERRKRK